MEDQFGKHLFRCRALDQRAEHSKGASFDRDSGIVQVRLKFIPRILESLV